MSSNTWNVITDSLGLLRDAAGLITDANRDAPTPCSEWTVTQVLQHAAGDQLAPRRNFCGTSGGIPSGFRDS